MSGFWGYVSMGSALVVGRTLHVCSVCEEVWLSRLRRSQTSDEGGVVS